MSGSLKFGRSCCVRPKLRIIALISNSFFFSRLSCIRSRSLLNLCRWGGTSPTKLLDLAYLERSQEGFLTGAL